MLVESDKLIENSLVTFATSVESIFFAHTAFQLFILLDLGIVILIFLIAAALDVKVNVRKVGLLGLNFLENLIGQFHFWLEFVSVFGENAYTSFLLFTAFIAAFCT